MKIFRKFAFYSIVFVFIISTLKAGFDLYTIFFTEQKLIYSKEQYGKILADDKRIKHCPMEVIMPNSFEGNNLLQFTLKSEYDHCVELFFDTVSKIFIKERAKNEFLKLAKERSSFKIKQILINVKKNEQEIHITFKNEDDKPV